MAKHSKITSAKRKGAAVEDVDYRNAASLREALRVFERRSEIVAREHGLTPRSYQLLLMIKTARTGDGNARLPELEERLQLGKSTVTELVLRTEENGLVRRDLDRTRPRGTAVHLTTAGERRLTEAVRALGDERGHLFAALAEIKQ